MYYNICVARYGGGLSDAEGGTPTQIYWYNYSSRAPIILDSSRQ